jgi:S-adenosylmethionine:tRNA ribosyltransferase-isomerase
MKIPELKPEDFTYELPENRIAKFPLAERDASKLLVYRNGKISHHIFKEISDIIPEDSLLIFNNTRVIRARLIFHKKTGAKIEIFCLEPHQPGSEINNLLKQSKQVEWRCMVGNKDKWRKNKETLELQKQFDDNNISLFCDHLENGNGYTVVRFSWNSDKTFDEILDIFGDVPIPPYLKRKPEEIDKTTYQTVYAKLNGAVAAPTAGFHFTDKILNILANKGVKEDYITLHVGAGTFVPIKTDKITDHPMHTEQIIITVDNITNLVTQDKNIICVGTTSLRTIESLYWIGVLLLRNGFDVDLNIEKLFPYQFEENELPKKEQALSAVLKYLEEKELDHLVAETAIFIFPPYKFRMCDILITNYHMPSSTLILLVAAFAGEDWRKIYNEALSGDYRFLSYGDSSILFK